MKFQLVFCLLMIYITTSFAQREVSKVINFSTDAEAFIHAGASIIPIESDYIVQCDYFAEGYELIDCDTLSDVVFRLSPNGEKVWQYRNKYGKKYPFIAQQGRIFGEVLLPYEDYFIRGSVLSDPQQIAATGEYYWNHAREFLISKMNYEGTIIDSASFKMDSTEKALYNIVDMDDYYLCLFKIPLYHMGFKKISKDFQKELLDSTYFYSYFYQIIKPTIQKYNDKILLAFEGARYDSFRLTLQILDDDLNIEKEFIGYPNIAYGNTPLCKPLSDGNLMVIWDKDSSKMDDFYPDQRMIIFDENLQPIKEKLFVFNERFIIFKIKYLKDGNIYLLGASQYRYSQNNELNHRLYRNPLIIKIDENGNILKQLEFIDERADKYIGLYDMCWNEQNQQYGLSGAVNYTSKIPFFYTHDRSTLFVTLDKDLCWNGNCNDIIIITSDSTSESPSVSVDYSEADKYATLYPNPTPGSFNIKPNGEQYSHFMLYDMNGKLILRSELSEIETSINMLGYPAGIYFIEIYSKDKKSVERHKIVLK